MAAARLDSEAAIVIREVEGEDDAFILALNAASTPAVGDLDAAEWARLRGWARRVLVAEAAGVPCGFMVLVGPGSAYPSDNYRWFEERYGRHLYVDRVAVDGSARRLGVGRRLYEAAVRCAREQGAPRLTCEVNEQPPNPDSLAFHQRLGFRQVESRVSPRLRKVVAMLVKELPA
jgi:uncharacterized protein